MNVIKGYNLDGYRNAIVLLWCSEQKTWKGLNVPDFMMVEGVYETKMGTESFTSISEFAKIRSERSNTRTGTSSFRDENRKLSASEAESKSDSGGGSVSSPVFAISATGKTDKYNSKNEQRKQFTRSETTKRANRISDKKSRTTSKVETMISEMKIEIIRYRAIIEEIKPNYLAPEFLNDFRALPDSFYRPDAPERFDFFIRRWGTHIVKAVNIGGKFTMRRTARNEGTVSVDDLQQSSQQEFDRITATNYGKNVQEESSKDFEFGISASGGAPSGAFSASASFGMSENDRNTNQSNEDTAKTTAENNLQQSASSQITSDKKRTSYDQMIIEVEGGSQAQGRQFANFLTRKKNLLQNFIFISFLKYRLFFFSEIGNIPRIKFFS